MMSHALGVRSRCIISVGHVGRTTPSSCHAIRKNSGWACRDRIPSLQWWISLNALLDVRSETATLIFHLTCNSDVRFTITTVELRVSGVQYSYRIDSPIPPFWYVEYGLVDINVLHFNFSVTWRISIPVSNRHVSLTIYYRNWWSACTLWDACTVCIRRPFTLAIYGLATT